MKVTQNELQALRGYSADRRLYELAKIRTAARWSSRQARHTTLSQTLRYHAGDDRKLNDILHDLKTEYDKLLQEYAEEKNAPEV